MEFLFLLRRQRAVSKKKKREGTRQRTVCRCQVVCSCLFLRPLCLGDLSWQKENIEKASDLNRSRFFFPFESFLLAYCLAEGTSPTANRGEGGGGVATLIADLARPNHWQQYGCNFHQEVLAKLSLALEKARIRKSVLKEMPSRTFHFGNWKKSDLNVIERGPLQQMEIQASYRGVTIQ